MSERIYYRCEQDIAIPVSVQEAFPFVFKKRKPVISLVGGGGKTSIMYALADAFKEMGRRVLVTTTTHIYCPGGNRTKEGSLRYEDVHAIHATTLQQVRKAWESGLIPVIGSLCAKAKLSMPEAELLREAMELSDVVLIEADGAKCMPCKVPGATEPVLLPESDIVIGLMGMDALKEPVESVCFRAALAKDWLWKGRDLKETALTKEDAALILTSSSGTKKDVGSRDYYVVLNKCDTKERLEEGIKLAQLLGKERVILSTKIQ